jgi:hypothetical protein
MGAEIYEIANNSLELRSIQCLNDNHSTVFSIGSGHGNTVNTGRERECIQVDLHGKDNDISSKADHISVLK